MAWAGRRSSACARPVFGVALAGTLALMSACSRDALRLPSPGQAAQDGGSEPVDLSRPGDLTPPSDLALADMLPANETLTFRSFTATNGSVAGDVATYPVPTPPFTTLDYVNPDLKAGTYQVSLAFQGDANGWNASFLPNATVTERVFNMGADGNHVGEEIIISADNPTGPATLVITLMTPAPSPPRQPTQQDLLKATAFGVVVIVLEAG
jgi:hypothetical protein